MGIEVEIKAWVDNFDDTLEKLKNNYIFNEEYVKEDIYFNGINNLTNQRQEVRLRNVNGEYVVTYKEREHRNKVEVNLEKEFNVDNSENFIYILNKLGFTEHITKSKKGFSFSSSLITIELSHVKYLGNFIEIEYIVENEDEVKIAIEEIYKILEQLNISKDKIEDKYYIEMLMNKKRDK